MIFLYFSCREHCVLIVITPKFAETYFLDSTRKVKKDYRGIKKVLDEALVGYTSREGVIREGYRKFGKFKAVHFAHKTDCCCMQQPENSDTDGYYVVHHMEDYIRQGQHLKKNSDITAWGKKMEEISPGDSRDEFRRVQVKFATILNKDVIHHAGVFNCGTPASLEEIKTRLSKQGRDADGPVSLADPTKKYTNDPYY